MRQHHRPVRPLLGGGGDNDATKLVRPSDQASALANLEVAAATADSGGAILPSCGSDDDADTNDEDDDDANYDDDSTGHLEGPSWASRSTPTDDGGGNDETVVLHSRSGGGGGGGGGSELSHSDDVAGAATLIRGAGPGAGAAVAAATVLASRRSQHSSSNSSGSVAENDATRLQQLTGTVRSHAHSGGSSSNDVTKLHTASAATVNRARAAPASSVHDDATVVARRLSPVATSAIAVGQLATVEQKHGWDTDDSEEEEEEEGDEDDEEEDEDDADAERATGRRNSARGTGSQQQQTSAAGIGANTPLAAEDERWHSMARLLTARPRNTQHRRKSDDGGGDDDDDDNDDETRLARLSLLDQLLDVFGTSSTRRDAAGRHGLRPLALRAFADLWKKSGLVGATANDGHSSGGGGGGGGRGLIFEEDVDWSIGAISSMPAIPVNELTTVNEKHARRQRRHAPTVA